MWYVFWKGGRMKQEWNWMMEKKSIGNSFPPQKLIEHLQKIQKNKVKEDDMVGC
jgi:hypothetical protein